LISFKGGKMKKIMVMFMTIMMAVGFNWSFPREASAVKQPVPREATVSFVTSVATLNYQGQKVQNQVQTVSLAKIERQLSPTEAMYNISGQGGLRIGKYGMSAFYSVAPITVNRHLKNEQLASENKILDTWLTVINGTLESLVHEHMVSKTWEHPFSLGLGAEFPKTIQVQFSARPLPEPDSKWIAISAESGLISFSALDEEFQEFTIYGRYRGVLVYSPNEDKFLQAGATFTITNGNDQFRIEQLQFAADASGNQLQPMLNLAPYLDFKPETPKIATPGSFPSWCIQASRVFDTLHLAIMTAAEGSTNPGFVSMLPQSMQNLLSHDYNFIEKMLGKEAADKFLGDWMKVLNFYNTEKAEGTAKAMYELGKDLGKDLIVAALNILPLGIGNIVKTVELYVSAKQAAFEQMNYDVNELLRAPFPANKYVKTSEPEFGGPVIGKLGRRPGVTGSTPSIFKLFTAIALVGVGVLAVVLLTKNLSGGGNSKYDGTYNYQLGSVHGISTSCSNCVFIKNGIISNNDPSSQRQFRNAVFVPEGTLTFEGPCPNGNNAIGYYEGKLVASNPYKWTGTWRCADGSSGGSQSTWQIGQ
jgi:hypothetical protein